MFTWGAMLNCTEKNPKIYTKKKHQDVWEEKQRKKEKNI
jgi:hypothetical protein